jgi:hypothetical protein
MNDFLRADGSMLRIYRAEVSDVNRKRRSIVATINTDSVDGYGTVVDPNGMDRSGYNDIVLWEHGLSVMRGTLPVGNCGFMRLIQDRGRTLTRAETIFYAKGSKGDDFTENLFQMYDDGDLTGFSVNGTPDMSRCSRPTKEELKARPELEGCKMIFRSWKLKEYSACWEPVNKECVTERQARSIIRAVDRGFDLDPELVKAAKKSLEPPAPALPPLGGRSYEAYKADVLSRLRGLFDPKKIEEQLRMQADYARGKV